MSSFSMSVIYIYAVEKWLEHRELESAKILENCFNYFSTNGFYHGSAMSLGILAIIFQQTQSKKDSMKLLERNIYNTDVLSKMPTEIQSIIQFFIGFSHGLNFNLKEAEKHLTDAQNILKTIYRKSIYSGYYLITLSQLTAVYALQGKIDLAYKQMKEVEQLIDEGIVTKNLDSFSKKQIIHSFNLVTFYIKSRFLDFKAEDSEELIQEIFHNIDRFHSNAIFFSEFLLSSNPSEEQLIKIKELNNPSTKRVEHVINFLIARTIQSEEQQILRSITKLKKRPVEERMTYTERAFADLLAAREYYSIKRFAEIAPLLKRYEKRLYRIEVLELRIFMEAFIQVGAFKNGDPLGPALQYMAIKKCRQYGFSRLEDKLLDYLKMQQRDIMKKT